MLNNQRIKRVQLDINQTTDFLLLGIVTADPDYKLSIALNNKFSISLKNISPVEVTEGNQPMMVFSRFSDLSGSPDLIFNLISNRSGKNFLFKKLKNIDYIFQIQDTENEKNKNRIAVDLREIESINAVFYVDIDTLKDKNLRYLTL